MRRPAAAVAVLGLLALLTVPGALGELFYTDRSGDSGLAPDITDLHVVDDPSGYITFHIGTNQRALASGADISVYVDSDRSVSTGEPRGDLGVDHEFSYGGLGLPFLTHYSGKFVVIDLNSTLSFAYVGGLTARVHRDDLDVTDRFRFVVEARQQDAEMNTVGLDVAPDSGSQEYVRTRTPPALVVGNATAAGKPRAGGGFTVSAPLRRSDDGPVATAKVRCRAILGGALLRATARVSSGRAQCSMRLPLSAKGRRLRGTLSVSLNGATDWVTRPFAFRVR
jgi:hypothetical protein